MVKIGSSSITGEHGEIALGAVDKLCAEVAGLRGLGHRIAIVTSGAIAAGLPLLGLSGTRPGDIETLQAISAVGQSRLMRVYDDTMGRHGLIGGQVLLDPLDFFHRQRYVQARHTILRMFEFGVVPIINENDVVAADEILWSDNDRLAALVANLLAADLLVMLTDTPGVLTTDPRKDENATLIEDITQVDHELMRVAGGPGSYRSRGGMASKLQAAKIAAWSGVRVVIAAAERPAVLGDATQGAPGVGTVVRPHDSRLSARKLWIAFALQPSGTILVDEGARKALVDRQTSLLPAGVVDVQGRFDADAAVEISDPAGRVFAKGLVRVSSDDLRKAAGRRTAELPPGMPHEVVHRDDLVTSLPS